MPKYIISILIFFLSHSAFAEWVTVVTGKTATVYIDPSSIRKSNETVKAWVLDDLTKPINDFNKNTPLASIKTQVEFNCLTEMSRSIYFIGYSDRMGKGNVIVSGDSPESSYYPSPPDSVGGMLLEIVCKHR